MTERERQLAIALRHVGQQGAMLERLADEQRARNQRRTRQVRELIESARQTDEEFMKSMGILSEGESTNGNN